MKHVMIHFLPNASSHSPARGLFCPPPISAVRPERCGRSRHKAVRFSWRNPRKSSSRVIRKSICCHAPLGARPLTRQLGPPRPSSQRRDKINGRQRASNHQPPPPLPIQILMALMTWNPERSHDAETGVALQQPPTAQIKKE